MSSFRKDPFGRAWVLISPERGLQASDFGSSDDDEDVTFPQPTLQDLEQTLLIPDSGSLDPPYVRPMIVRPEVALVEDKPVAFHGEPPFEQASSAGLQEMVIEHRDPAMRLESMPREHLLKVLRLYRDRLEALSEREGVKHVQLTRSVGWAAGSRLPQPHGQLLAVPVTNRWLDEELTSARTHFEVEGECLFCSVLTQELEVKERIVTSNEWFVAFAPFAAKHPFETWIMPRAHPKSFSALPDTLLPGLAEILQTVLGALNSALDGPPYNMILHTLPSDDDAFHWHFEILPRLTSRSGFDWASGFYVNPTPPEAAAHFLREALALQQVSP